MARFRIRTNRTNCASVTHEFALDNLADAARRHAGCLARSVRQLIATVEDLAACDIGFRSLTGEIDTTTPGGRLVLHVFGAPAEFERDLYRERTRAGLDAARARGPMTP